MWHTAKENGCVPLSAKADTKDKRAVALVHLERSGNTVYAIQADHNA